MQLQLFPQLTSQRQSLGDRVRERKKINKLLVNPYERLNNIILERTIENNTTQPQNLTAKESNSTSEIEAHRKKDQSPPTHALTCSSQVITCLSYGTSLLAVTIVNNYAVT